MCALIRHDRAARSINSISRQKLEQFSATFNQKSLKAFDMETNFALGGSTFKITKNNNFYFGSRRVTVHSADLLERIREAVQDDNVFLLRDLFREAGGNTMDSAFRGRR